ncbi:MAG: DMT family transporter [Bacteroidia bacterium]|jgi:drug/metabolite transporter (DMT)-like permease|nr:DMT family transporter [Bacteroidia bacterium]
MKTSLKVHLALFMVSLIYGATFTIAKQVMPLYVKPFAFILMRVSVAAVFIFIFHSIFVKKKITDKKDFLQLGISALFGVAFNMLLFFKGLSITTPINGAVLMLNTPIFVAIFASVYLKEKISTTKIAGIIIAAGGALVLMGGNSFSFSNQTLAGDLMVTANAIIYAFYLVYAKSLMQKYHPLTVTMWSFMFGFLVVLPFGANEFMAINFLELPAEIWLGIAFITIGSTFLTYVLNAYALQKASSSLVGSYIYLQPVLAAIIALISGKDQLTTLKLICMLVIFIGVFMVSKKSVNEKTSHE